MPVELSHLMQLAMGRLPALQVGDLPRPVAEYMHCHPAIVWLGAQQLQKIVRDHPEIRVEQLQCLPFAIHDARYYCDKERSNCLTAYYTAELRGQYLIGIKPAIRGGEVWIQTFYRQDDKTALRRQSKSSLIHDPICKRTPLI
jgi:hypothetical protein